MVDEKFTLAWAERIVGRLDQIDAKQAALGAEIATMAAQVNAVHEDVRMRNAYVNQSEAAMARQVRRNVSLMAAQEKSLRRSGLFLIAAAAGTGATGFAAGTVVAFKLMGWAP